MAHIEQPPWCADSGGPTQSVAPAALRAQWRMPRSCGPGHGDHPGHAVVRVEVIHDECAQAGAGPRRPCTCADLADAAHEDWLHPVPESPCRPILLSVCGAAGFTPDGSTTPWNVPAHFVAHCLGVARAPFRPS